ncbi:MAG: signal peptide peptidase SppA [Candidatus Binatus sp.]|uniref:signal peptide peptidase SppA n=1 Tax=Candidatus Binatus sp. TaxID=2811406 RepID=UPI00271B6161|nr:signal peptide peptidase SppA [Candidatus Binatus sp.]MDO8431673.1 signal peptide peptidase SppA [Candidatus Binatus sp.]
MLRRFFRWILRTALILFAFFLVVVISEYIAHRVQPGSVLLVSMRGPVVERGDGGLLGLMNPHQTPLNELRSAIDHAAKDERIVGIAIEVIDPEMELAQAQEIVQLIKGFKANNKWTSAYIETAGEADPGNLPYMVASTADEVSLMPQGELNLIGVGVRELFARGTLDWLGIVPNFSAFGQYKSAANMFLNKDFTAEQKLEDEALVGSMFDQIVAATVAQRKLTSENVKSLIDQAPLNAQASLKAHLVDRIEYHDQFTERVKHHGGGAEHKIVEYANYRRPGMFSRLKGPGDEIAVIYGEGDIQRGDSGINPLSGPGAPAMTSDDLTEAFKTAREDDNVRAVLFRVDSPGGSVIASELIRREVELTAKSKPVVVSMSSFAASGGYWVSAPAAKIFAEPGTITGSIGVVGGKFNVSPAVQKLYANTGAVTRGANVEMFSMWTDFTPGQAKLFHDQMLGDTYRDFLKIVADGRHMKTEEVDAVAQGRVWTGEQALKIKLVDSLGGFDDAMTAAKSMARLSVDQPVGIIELPERPGLLQSLLSGKIGASLGAGATNRFADPLIQLIRAALSGRSVFRAVYCPIIPVL